MPPVASRALAATLILVLTIVNYRGVKLGAGVQNVFTTVKLLGLFVLIGSIFFWHGPVHSQNLTQATGLSAGQLGSATIACIFSYNGWFAIGMVGGEIKDPQRNLPRAIILGVAVVTLVYLLANITYLRTLTISEIAGTDRVAEAAATRTMGSIGSTFVALTILCSTFGATNSTIMSSSRVYFALARDGLFFRPFGNIHPAFETPYVSLLGSGIWSAILALSGSYTQLVSYSVFTFWIFYGVTVAGMMVLRRRCPDAVRPYRMFGYPVTPLLFIGVAGTVAVLAFISSPLTSMTGLSILVAGVPAYYGWQRFAGPAVK